MSDLLLGIDVGATAIKAGVFSLDGRLVASASERNAPEQDPQGPPGWMVWNPEALWASVCRCVRACVEKAGGASGIKGVACTGFGTDGLPVDRTGAPLYPFISWHCTRTIPERARMSERISDAQIYAITGYHNYPINTANRMLWFRRHKPELLDKAYRWLWIQDYVAFRLSGQFTTECTIASTSMLLDLAKRTWSARMIEAAEIDAELLPPVSEAGTPIGAVTAKAAADCGLVAGTPVVTGGHDCEVAVLGAGVNDPGTWIDITGTWEILVATVDRFQPAPEHMARGLDYECHAVPGEWICQSLMIAGAAIEWIRENFYRDTSIDHVYETMFAEANVNSGGVYVLPSFVHGMGPDAARHALGSILGLQTMTSRGQIVRATLEGLCFQLRKQIDAVAGAVGRMPNVLRVVGGGQRNSLWLQLKADITGLPVEVTGHTEATLLGAATLAGIGVGLYRDVPDAMGMISRETELFLPNASAHEAYADSFSNIYLPLPGALQNIYANVEKKLSHDLDR